MGWRQRKEEEAKEGQKRDLGRVKRNKEKLRQTGVKGPTKASTRSPTNSGPISLGLSTDLLLENIHEYYWQSTSSQQQVLPKYP